VSKLIQNAKQNITLIDNYVDENVLKLLSKRNKKVQVTIYTKNLDKTFKLDLMKHNSQYKPITVKIFTKAHDRFLIIDNKIVYHFGASLKDLGKKWFAFSRMELNVKDILNKLELGAIDE